MKAVFRIKRYNPEKDEKPFFREYELEADPKSPILDCLNRIKWEQDETLSFRRSCGHAICGSCAMTINNENSLACQTLLRDMGPRVKVEPLRSYPIIRDLVVDLTKFYDKLYSILPYFINETPPPDRERLQSPADQKIIEDSASCILCGSCTSSCPSFWADDDYLGPAALLKAFRFIFDTRDQAQLERLNLINSGSGPWKCHTILNCNEACPKENNITDAIARLKLKLSSL